MCIMFCASNIAELQYMKRNVAVTIVIINSYFNSKKSFIIIYIPHFVHT